MRYASTMALTVFGLVFATVFAVPVSVDVSPADETFTFAVAGDIGWNETGAKSQVMLRALQRDKANLSFFLADGDLSYNTTAGTEGAWCDFVKSYVGSQLPFELLAGDQEDNDAVRIGNFAACLPDQLSGKGAYGQGLLDALLIKKVDLILHGDQHSYQRTKQLRCAIRSAGFYFPECIADSDGQFTTGAGSVIAIVGTGGRGFSSVGLTTDAD